MTILITGATGKTGRRIADRLTALGLPVRSGSRSATPAFDWADRATYAPALDGVESAYLSYYPDLAFPGALADIEAFVEQAKAAGVGRLVLLSGRSEEQAQAAEEVVKGSGLEWTILTCSWFMQNFSEGFLLDPVLSGVIALPAQDVAEPFLDVDDIAEIAVAALTGDAHAGRHYELTGPRLLTFADVAAELSKATGRDIVYLPVTSAEFLASAVEHGVPEEEAAGLNALFTDVLDGRNAYVADGVRQALGRPARDFTDFARTFAQGTA
ncbi:NmrA family NAD(P)-binding protein [Nonomuraea antri]|uniref:NmrA family NAD(P)-binding protein n=1 Tax=Nonomuraea antri TaxID=2730852 RepID=UPI001C2C17B1|nr:NmrA family NAD(P)-binding protein [Nonomuraea antri]